MNAVRRAALAAVFSCASLAQAAEVNFTGKARCLDGEGSEKFYEVKATLSGNVLDIAFGSTRLQRPVDSFGNFVFSFMVPDRRGGNLAHMEGVIRKDAIVMRHSGGRATCSASLAPAGG